MYLSDYHTHSRLSFDAHAPLSELAEAAADAGWTSCASPTTSTSSTKMGFRRRATTGPPPWPSISRPSPPPGERLTLKLGLELGMPHLNPAAAAAICARPEADFILGSVHNLSPERGGTDLFFLDFSTVQACYDALDDYFASLALLAATDFYDVLAHLIYPLRYMQAPVTLNRYQDAIRAILRTAVEKGRGMEVNTCRGRTLEEWRPILALYRDCGGELVTVGSDAHTPADVGKGVRAGLRAAAGVRLPPRLHL